MYQIVEKQRQVAFPHFRRYVGTMPARPIFLVNRFATVEDVEAQISREAVEEITDSGAEPEEAFTTTPGVEPSRFERASDFDGFSDQPQSSEAESESPADRAPDEWA